jgi:2-methylisocitrate lyase-like PEP mutase family enzyme
MKRSTRFRQLISNPAIAVMPGVQDALTAKIAADVGFQVITCGGYTPPPQAYSANRIRRS